VTERRSAHRGGKGAPAVTPQDPEPPPEPPAEPPDPVTVSGTDAPFGRLLRAARRRAGLSQQALAEISGLSVDAIAALERGRRRAPRAFTVRVLAQALELDERHTSALHAAASGTPEVRREPRLRVPPGPIVGRDEDVSALATMLGTRGPRCITLTGPGGIGKTRLALEVARHVAPTFAAGAAWVGLEGVTTAAAVPDLVRGALDLRSAAEDAVGALVEDLRDRDVLLVLDNCEHLVDACADLVAALLAGTSGLRVLTTSRERLDVEGETVWPVLPLEGPAEGCPPELLDSYAASNLFLHHARLLDPTFRVAPEQLRSVVSLCRRLDGLPLALELAAARTTAMTVSEVAAALETGLDVLQSRTRTTVPRHQTLLATLEWSFDLLTPVEQLMLVRLAVFADGCTREAAEAVCVRGEIIRADVLPLIEALISKSLVVRRDHAGTARIAMLDTIRRYAGERAAKLDPDHEVELRHASYFCELAEIAGAELEVSDGPRWLDQIDAEAANVRKAIAWSTRAGQPELALRTAGALWRWCYLRGHYAEGRAWLQDALDHGNGCSPAARVKAVTGAALLAFLQCEYESARRGFEEAITAYRGLDNRDGEAWAWQRLGSIAREQGRYQDAERLHRTSIAIIEETHGPEEARRDLGYPVFILWLRGDLDAAAALGAEALEAIKPGGQGERLVWAMLNLGAVATYRGDLGAARSLLSESLTVAEEIGYREGIAWSFNLLGVVSCRVGDFDAAEELLRDSLELHRALGDQWRTASVLDGLALCAAARAESVRAARLLGAAAAIRSRIGVPIPTCEQGDHDRTVAMITEELGVDGLQSARLAGSAIPLDRLVAPRGWGNLPAVRTGRRPPVASR